ncbi:VOC family protein [Alicyclobacillus fastidiosus]|uniref:VOC family protein n=1 Tax=Alicyclobacillus fastidiosus TaxID=392011 RepID=UPI0024E17216|nr:VOC family protein [Alicyclobacillus fastidiosus]
MREFDRARTFYEDVLKFSILHLDATNRWCLYAIPTSQTAVAIYSNREMAGESPSQTRLVLEVKDLNQMIHYLQIHNIEVEPIRFHEQENFRISGFIDPSGNVWRIWSRST